MLKTMSVTLFRAIAINVTLKRSKKRKKNKTKHKSGPYDLYPIFQAFKFVGFEKLRFYSLTSFLFLTFVTRSESVSSEEQMIQVNDSFRQVL